MAGYNSNVPPLTPLKDPARSRELLLGALRSGLFHVVQTLPVAGVHPGELVWSEGDKALHVWNGSAWEKLDVGSSGAPSGAQYLVLALDATLTNERRLVVGTGLSYSDGGAGGDYALAHAADATALARSHHAQKLTKGDALPTSGMEEGDLHWKTDTNKYYQYNGSDWVEMPTASTSENVSLLAGGDKNNRPVSANPAGLYAAHDTGEVFIYFDGSTTGPGELSVVAHGLLSQRPATADLGSIYAATDEDKLYAYV